MNQTLITIFALWFISILLSSTAYAAFIPNVGIEQAKDKTAYMVINNRRAVHFITTNGKLSQTERARITAERLTNQLKSGLRPESVWYRVDGKTARVTANEATLFVVTQADAKAHRSMVDRLAITWARKIRELISLPPLKATPSTVLVPLGETRIVKIESLQTKPMEVLVSDLSKIGVDGKTKPGSLILTGLQVGDARIEVRCGECSIGVDVSVRKYAAYPAAQSGRAVVTGTTVAESLIKRAIRDAAGSSVNLQPGVSIVDVDLSEAPHNPGVGKTTDTMVQVIAQGYGYIPTKLPVRVELENRFLPRMDASGLMYSNDPEQLTKYQVLFTGRIDSSGPVRLLYHHQNMMNTRVGFMIEVQNPGTSPAELHIIEGIAKPITDTIAVGYRAGLDFLEDYGNSAGRVTELQPSSRKVLVSQPLDYTSTASGIVELRQLSGEPLIIRVIAKPEEQRRVEDPVETSIFQSILNPDLLIVSDSVYPNPLINMEATYTARQKWLFLRLGKDHLKHSTQNKVLYGNYGVIYDIEVKIENPTVEDLPVELAFEATAGPASGVFIVNGKTVPVRFIQGPDEVRIYSTVVPAGMDRTLSVRTIPLSGSNYPATIIVRPAAR